MERSPIADDPEERRKQEDYMRKDIADRFAEKEKRLKESYRKLYDENKSQKDRNVEKINEENNEIIRVRREALEKRHRSENRKLDRAQKYPWSRLNYFLANRDNNGPINAAKEGMRIVFAPDDRLQKELNRRHEQERKILDASSSRKTHEAIEFQNVQYKKRQDHLVERYNFDHSGIEASRDQDIQALERQIAAREKAPDLSRDFSRQAKGNMRDEFKSRATGQAPNEKGRKPEGPSDDRGLEID